MLKLENCTSISWVTIITAVFQAKIVLIMTGVEMAVLAKGA